MSPSNDIYLKNNDVCRDSISFPIGSMEAPQGEGGGLWIHKVIVKANSADHNGQTYKVRVMKMGGLITCSTRHIRKMSVMAEQYLRKMNVKSSGHIHRHRLD